ncbi:zinc finger MYND domain-containing protein [bacterium]|jgi:hypothetical protein|nr:zinc finger MYND domain-containing protein [bacterium]
MRLYLRSIYQKLYFFILTLPLILITLQANAHIYQINVVKLKNGFVRVLLSDFHHMSLLASTEHMGIEKSTLIEKANQEGRSFYHFLENSPYLTQNTEILVEKTVTFRRPGRILNLEAYQAALTLPPDIMVLDFFDFLSDMGITHGCEEALLGERKVKISGSDNRDELDRKILDVLAVAHLEPEKVLDSYHDLLKTHGSEWVEKVNSEIRAYMSYLEENYSKELDFLEYLATLHHSVSSNIPLSEWKELSASSFLENIHEINSKLLGLSNLKVDLHLLIQVLENPNPFVVIHGGGLHQEQVIKFLRTFTLLDRFAVSRGEVDPGKVLADGFNLDVANSIHASLKELSVCPICFKTSVKLFNCARCKKTFYCGRDCQLKHWPEHKKNCTQPLATSEGTRGGEVSSSKSHTEISLKSSCSNSHCEHSE